MILCHEWDDHVHRYLQQRVLLCRYQRHVADGRGWRRVTVFTARNWNQLQDWLDRTARKRMLTRRGPSCQWVEAVGWPAALPHSRAARGHGLLRPDRRRAEWRETSRRLSG